MLYGCCWPAVESLFPLPVYIAINHSNTITLQFTTQKLDSCRVKPPVLLDGVGIKKLLAQQAIARYQALGLGRNDPLRKLVG